MQPDSMLVHTKSSSDILKVLFIATSCLVGLRVAPFILTIRARTRLAGNPVKSYSAFGLSLILSKNAMIIKHYLKRSSAGQQTAG